MTQKVTLKGSASACQEGIGSYWSVTGAAMETSGGTLLAFALSLAPDPQQQERVLMSVAATWGLCTIVTLYLPRLKG